MREYSKDVSRVRPKPKGGKRGIVRRDAQIRVSQTVAFLLRHGGEASGLPMRKDGYVAVDDLLSHPHLRDVDIFMLEKIVKEDPKNRFHLLYDSRAQHIPGTPSRTKIWWIRANQGHSLTDVDPDLEEIIKASRVKMAVHGTTFDAWKSIREQGLSTMGRNHIHFAQGVGGTNIMSGIRNSSQVLIFINLEKALSAGIKFYLSSNGVVLTSGDGSGFLSPLFFKRVEHVRVQKTPLLPEMLQDGFKSLPNPETAGYSGEASSQDEWGGAIYRRALTISKAR